MTPEQLTALSDNTSEYDAFMDKFKPKKTTDDCYTPPEIYDIVRDWACKEYNIDPNCIVRPFYPGGDYERFNYPDGCVILDNPPFSILSKICEFYLEHNIDFFLFAPSLTCFSPRNVTMRLNHIVCDAHIVYHNGAVVRTAFVTNFGGDIVAQTAPELGAKLNAINKKPRAAVKANYEYPHHVLTAAMLQRYSHYGIDFKVHRDECMRISGLDAQKDFKKAIFGGGLLLSERAAAKRAAIERAAIERATIERAAIERATTHWQLSDRERELVSTLGVKEDNNQ